MTSVERLLHPGRKPDGVRVETECDPAERYHEMVCVGESVYRDKLGRLGSRTWRWWVYVCNNPECPGRSLVRVDIIEGYARRRIGAAVRWRRHHRGAT